MKKILLLFSLTFYLIQLHAQDVPCVPDPAFADSMGQVVSPLPLDPNTGEGGLDAFPACIGEPFELVFTLRVGDSATVNGFNVDLFRAEITTTGAIEGLPEGINYFCNPPDCIFPDTTLGCIVLRGTPTENNTVGVNNLVISTNVILDILGSLASTIPGPLFAGEFNLTVNEMGACSSVSTNDFLAANIALANIPNPVIDRTMIEVSSEISGDFQFRVFDVAGQLLHNQPVQLNTGYNTFEYDASKLGAGMYIYAIGNETGAISEKMIVGRQ